MSYELRMHLIRELSGASVDESFDSKQGDMKVAIHDGIEIAHVDLCQISAGPVQTVIYAAKTMADKGSIYERDGNTKIITDRCGDFLMRVPASVVMEALESESAEAKKYRRFKIARAILKAAFEGFDKKDLFCYFFGH